MAVQLLGNAKTYQGLSTDPKPADVPTGSTFTELDTGAVAQWSGTAWFRQPGAATTFDTESGMASLLITIATELGKIRRMTAIANELDDDELEPDSPQLS